MKRDGESVADTVASGSAEVGSRGLDSQLTSASVLASANTVLPAGPTTRPIPAQPDVLPEVDAGVYIQLDEFARGGLGRIIRAKDTRTGRTVAIKEMLVSSADAAARFVREALVTSNLQHPAIVPVYEVGRWTTGQPFYAMKLVKGRPLDQVIAASKDLDSRLALLPHLVAVADALAYAHGERVIHRDLKPHNVLCGAHGETVVIDWGLARRLDEQDPAVSMPRVTSAPPGATYVGAIMGTPGYMPPEQAWGERVDERADVYAIGAILYHVLSGRPPFAGKDLQDVIDKVRSAGPAPLREIDARVPPDLATIVERAMAREPGDRYPSAAELASDLKRFTEGQLVLAHHYTRGERVRRFVRKNRGVLALATAAVVALGVVGVVSIRNVLDARDAAEEQRKRADRNSETAEHNLITAHVDRSRAELAADRPESALAFALEAARAANGKLDDEVRFIAGQAADRLPPVRRRAVANLGAIALVSGSDDLLLSDTAGVVRWSPDSDTIRWKEPTGTGDLIPLGADRVAAGRDVDIAFLDVATGKVLDRLTPTGTRTFRGYLGTDREKRFIAAPTKDTVELFEVATKQRVASIPLPDVDSAPLIAPDGSAIVVAVPTTTTFVQRMSLVDHAGKATQLCGNCSRGALIGTEVAVVTVSEPGRASRVIVADWKGKTRIEIIPNTTSNALDVAGDSESGLIAIACQDGLVEVHDLATGKLLWHVTIRDRINQVTLDKRGRLWVLGAFSGTAVHDARSGVELARWSVGGAALYLDEARGRIALLHPASGAATWSIGDSPVRAFAPTAARVRRLVLLADGTVATCSDDGTVAVTAVDGTVRVLGKHTARATDLLAMPSGGLLSTSRDNTTVGWNVAGGKRFELPSGLRAEIAADGTIATGGVDGVFKLWGADGSPLRTLGKLDKEPMAVRWSRDGKLIAGVDDQGATKVWDRTGKEIRALPKIHHGIDVAFSPDGRWLIRADSGAKWLYALDGGKDRLLKATRNSEKQSYSSTFTADGSRVLVVGTGFATVWDVASGDVVTDVPTGTDLIASAFVLGERLMVAGGVDRKLHVWHVASGAEVASLAAPDEIYFMTVRDDRLGVATLGAAMVWKLSRFTGDLAALEATVACRSGVTVAEGSTHRRDIDFERCNRAKP